MHIAQDPRALVVQLDGRVDVMNVQQSRDHFLSYLAQGSTRFVIDLSRVQFMDSAGMALLVSVLKRARQAGGDVRFVQPLSNEVRRMLQLTRLDQVLQVVPTCDEALAQL